MKKSKDSLEYVLNHQYGYGQEKAKLNKLELRNFEDLKIYVNDVITNAFYATYENGILKFFNENSKCKIDITRA